MTDQFKMLVVKQVFNILPITGEKIIDAEDVRALGEQLFAKMRAKKPRPASNQDTALQMHVKILYHHSRRVVKDIPIRAALFHPSAASAIGTQSERYRRPPIIANGIGPQSACSGGEILQ
jgi:hypothetical protein